MAKKKVEDLSTANPGGRFDVLAYRTAEKLIGRLEAKTGQVIWPQIKDDIQHLASKHLSGGIEIPPIVQDIAKAIVVNLALRRV